MRVNCQPFKLLIQLFLILLSLIDHQQLVNCAPKSTTSDNQQTKSQTIKKSESDFDPGSIFASFFPTFEDVAQEFNFFGFPILSGPTSKAPESHGSNDNHNQDHQNHPVARLHVVNDEIPNATHLAAKDIKGALAELHMSPDITLHKHTAKVIGRGHLMKESDGSTHFVQDYNQFPFPMMSFHHPVHRHLLILHGNMAHHDNKTHHEPAKGGHNSKPEEWTLDHMLSFIKSKRPLQLHDTSIPHDDLINSHSEMNKKWTQQEVYALIHLLEKLFKSKEMVEGDFSWDNFVRNALPWPGPLASKWQSLCLEPGLTLQQLQSQICNPIEPKDKQNWCPPSCTTRSVETGHSSDGQAAIDSAKLSSLSNELKIESPKVSKSGQGRLITRIKESPGEQFKQQYSTLTTRSTLVPEKSDYLFDIDGSSDSSQSDEVESIEALENSDGPNDGMTTPTTIFDDTDYPSSQNNKDKSSLPGSNEQSGKKMATVSSLDRELDSKSSDSDSDSDSLFIQPVIAPMVVAPVVVSSIGDMDEESTNVSPSGSNGLTKIESASDKNLSSKQDSLPTPAGLKSSSDFVNEKDATSSTINTPNQSSVIGSAPSINRSSQRAKSDNVNSTPTRKLSSSSQSTKSNSDEFDSVFNFASFNQFFMPIESESLPSPSVTKSTDHQSSVVNLNGQSTKVPKFPLGTSAPITSKSKETKMSPSVTDTRSKPLSSISSVSELNSSPSVVPSSTLFPADSLKPSNLKLGTSESNRVSKLSPTMDTLESDSKRPMTTTSSIDTGKLTTPKQSMESPLSGEKASSSNLQEEQLNDQIVDSTIMAGALSAASGMVIANAPNVAMSSPQSSSLVAESLNLSNDKSKGSVATKNDSKLDFQKSKNEQSLPIKNTSNLMNSNPTVVEESNGALDKLNKASPKNFDGTISPSKENQVPKTPKPSEILASESNQPDANVELNVASLNTFVVPIETQESSVKNVNASVPNDINSKSDKIKDSLLDSVRSTSDSNDRSLEQDNVAENGSKENTKQNDGKIHHLLGVKGSMDKSDNDKNDDSVPSSSLYIQPIVTPIVSTPLIVSTTDLDSKDQETIDKSPSTLTANDSDKSETSSDKQKDSTTDAIKADLVSNDKSLEKVNNMSTNSTSVKSTGDEVKDSDRQKSTSEEDSGRSSDRKKTPEKIQNETSQQNSQSIDSTINSGILASGILLENESPIIASPSSSPMSTQKTTKKASENVNDNANVTGMKSTNDKFTNIPAENMTTKSSNSSELSSESGSMDQSDNNQDEESVPSSSLHIQPIVTPIISSPLIVSTTDLDSTDQESIDKSPSTSTTSDKSETSSNKKKDSTTDAIKTDQVSNDKSLEQRNNVTTKGSKNGDKTQNETQNRTIEDSMKISDNHLVSAPEKNQTLQPDSDQPDSDVVFNVGSLNTVIVPGGIDSVKGVNVEKGNDMSTNSTSVKSTGDKVNDSDRQKSTSEEDFERSFDRKKTPEKTKSETSQQNSQSIDSTINSGILASGILLENGSPIIASPSSSPMSTQNTAKNASEYVNDISNVTGIKSTNDKFSNIPTENSDTKSANSQLSSVNGSLNKYDNDKNEESVPSSSLHIQPIVSPIVSTPLIVSTTDLDSTNEKIIDKSPSKLPITKDSDKIDSMIANQGPDELDLKKIPEASERMIENSTRIGGSTISSKSNEKPQISESIQFSNSTLNQLESRASTNVASLNQLVVPIEIEGSPGIGNETNNSKSSTKTNSSIANLSPTSIQSVTTNQTTLQSLIKDSDKRNKENSIVSSSMVDVTPIQSSLSQIIQTESTSPKTNESLNPEKADRTLILSSELDTIDTTKPDKAEIYNNKTSTLPEVSKTTSASNVRGSSPSVQASGPTRKQNKSITQTTPKMISTSSFPLYSTRNLTAAPSLPTTTSAPLSTSTTTSKSKTKAKVTNPFSYQFNYPFGLQFNNPIQPTTSVPLKNVQSYSEKTATPTNQKTVTTPLLKMTTPSLDVSVTESPIANSESTDKTLTVFSTDSSSPQSSVPLKNSTNDSPNISTSTFIATPSFTSLSLEQNKQNSAVEKGKDDMSVSTLEISQIPQFSSESHTKNTNSSRIEMSGSNKSSSDEINSKFKANGSISDVPNGVPEGSSPKSGIDAILPTDNQGSSEIHQPDSNQSELSLESNVASLNTFVVPIETQESSTSVKDVNGSPPNDTQISISQAKTSRKEIKDSSLASVKSTSDSNVSNIPTENMKTKSSNSSELSSASGSMDQSDNNEDKDSVSSSSLHIQPIVTPIVSTPLIVSTTDLDSTDQESIDKSPSTSMTKGSDKSETSSNKKKDSTTDAIKTGLVSNDVKLEQRNNVTTKGSKNEDKTQNETQNKTIEDSMKNSDKHLVSPPEKNQTLQPDSDQPDSDVVFNVGSLNTVIVPNETNRVKGVNVEKGNEMSTNSTSLKSNGGNSETHSIMNNSTSEETNTEDEENCDESTDEETTTIGAIETHQPTKVSEQKDQKGSSNVQPSQQNSQTIGSTINSGILASGILLENESPSLSQMSTSNLQKAPVSENNNSTMTGMNSTIDKVPNIPTENTDMKSSNSSELSLVNGSIDNNQDRDSVPSSSLHIQPIVTPIVSTPLVLSTSPSEISREASDNNESTYALDQNQDNLGSETAAKSDIVTDSVNNSSKSTNSKPEFKANDTLNKTPKDSDKSKTLQSDSNKALNVASLTTFVSPEQTEGPSISVENVTKSPAAETSNDKGKFSAPDAIKPDLISHDKSLEKVNVTTEGLEKENTKKNDTENETTEDSTENVNNHLISTSKNNQSQVSNSMKDSNQPDSDVELNIASLNTFVVPTETQESSTSVKDVNGSLPNDTQISNSQAKTTSDVVKDSPLDSVKSTSNNKPLEQINTTKKKSTIENTKQNDTQNKTTESSMKYSDSHLVSAPGNNKEERAEKTLQPASNQSDSGVVFNVDSLNTFIVPDKVKGSSNMVKDVNNNESTPNNTSTIVVSGGIDSVKGVNVEKENDMSTNSSSVKSTGDKVKDSDRQKSTSEEDAGRSSDREKTPEKTKSETSQQNSQSIDSTINSGILASGILLENESPIIASPSSSPMSTQKLRKKCLKIANGSMDQSDNNEDKDSVPSSSLNIQPIVTPIISSPLIISTTDLDSTDQESIDKSPSTSTTSDKSETSSNKKKDSTTDAIKTGLVSNDNSLEQRNNVTTKGSKNEDKTQNETQNRTIEDSVKNFDNHLVSAPEKNQTLKPDSDQPDSDVVFNVGSLNTVIVPDEVKGSSNMVKDVNKTTPNNTSPNTEKIRTNNTSSLELSRKLAKNNTIMNESGMTVSDANKSQKSAISSLPIRSDSNQSDSTTVLNGISLSHFITPELPTNGSKISSAKLSTDQSPTVTVSGKDKGKSNSETNDFGANQSEIETSKSAFDNNSSLEQSSDSVSLNAQPKISPIIVPQIDTNTEAVNQESVLVSPKTLTSNGLKNFQPFISVDNANISKVIPEAKSDNNTNQSLITESSGNSSENKITSNSILTSLETTQPQFTSESQIVQLDTYNPDSIPLNGKTSNQTESVNKPQEVKVSNVNQPETRRESIDSGSTIAPSIDFDESKKASMNSESPINMLDNLNSLKNVDSNSTNDSTKTVVASSPVRSIDLQNSKSSDQTVDATLATSALTSTLTNGQPVVEKELKNQQKSSSDLDNRTAKQQKQPISETENNENVQSTIVISSVPTENSSVIEKKPMIEANETSETSKNKDQNHVVSTLEINQVPQFSSESHTINFDLSGKDSPSSSTTKKKSTIENTKKNDTQNKTTEDSMKNFDNHLVSAPEKNQTLQPDSNQSDSGAVFNVGSLNIVTVPDEIKGASIMVKDVNESTPNNTSSNTDKTSTVTVPGGIDSVKGVNVEKDNDMSTNSSSVKSTGDKVKDSDRHKSTSEEDSGRSSDRKKTLEKIQNETSKQNSQIIDSTINSGILASGILLENGSPIIASPSSSPMSTQKTAKKMSENVNDNSNVTGMKSTNDKFSNIPTENMTTKSSNSSNASELSSESGPTDQSDNNEDKDSVPSSSLNIQPIVTPIISSPLIISTTDLDSTDQESIDKSPSKLIAKDSDKTKTSIDKKKDSTNDAINLVRTIGR
ncbi:uncharacterized protein LOC128396058 [Panonychus citri]|uniref:uncharacterized protein LOC128396058 n=1 Tax=Panonychus citri TaxID=50023 RepID=UPI002307780B|nr:uncharacterized protein LOC128396058 [Panonychus citri]